jgi:hypothetical protein
MVQALGDRFHQEGRQLKPGKLLKNQSRIGILTSAAKGNSTNVSGIPLVLAPTARHRDVVPWYPRQQSPGSVPLS